MKYVTLSKLKDHLRIDYDDEDTLLEGYIEAASAAVKNYLKSASPFELLRDADDNPVIDSDGNPEYAKDADDNRVISKTVQHATLFLVGYFYADRDNDEGKEFDMGYLPKPVMALLYPLRDPAMR